MKKQRDIIDAFLNYQMKSNEDCKNKDYKAIL